MLREIVCSDIVDVSQVLHPAVFCGEHIEMANYCTWTIRPMDIARLQKANGQQGHESKTSAEVGHSIPVSVWEEAGAWHVQAEVPGVPASAVTAEFYQDRLTIQYDRLRPDQSKVTYDNCNYGQFQRLIRITDEVQSDGITARIENGLLLIRLPKSKVASPLRIPVSE